MRNLTFLTTTRGKPYISETFIWKCNQNGTDEDYACVYTPQKVIALIGDWKNNTLTLDSLINTLTK